MLALVGATAVAQKGNRRTAEEQREALAAFKQHGSPASPQEDVRALFNDPGPLEKGKGRS
jgi:hypothetical protein